MTKTRLLGALFAALIPLAAHALETLHWKRLPLPVNLHVGEDRVIFIERDMRVGIPANLKERLRVQSANGAIYLRALAEMQAVRVQLNDVASGEWVLLDVTASDPEGDPPFEPLRIEMNDSARQTKAESAVVPPEPQLATPVPILLTRFAAQNLYAPLRAIEPVEGIRRASVRDDLDLSTLLPTHPVACRVVAAWRLSEHTVTAVLVKNISPRPVRLDAHELQGAFVAATFQHPFLGSRGEATDTTAIYLVTRHRGLAESLLPASGRSVPGDDPDEK